MLGLGPHIQGRPGVASFVVTYVLFAGLAWFAWTQVPERTAVGLYTSVFWTLPVLASLVGTSGIVTSIRSMQTPRPTTYPEMVTKQELVVVVPTVGRADVVPALERVIESLDRHLATLFRRVRIDVVMDEGADAERAVRALVERCPRARLLVVPRAYITAGHTRFKARAVQYAQAARQEAGEERDDLWVLHMDDDTGVRADTACELARFITAQQDGGPPSLDLAQGILCYPREYAANRLVWLADSVRPACDLSMFAATTGRGSPISGLHGELLLVRASVEGAIGWDFGPRTLVEDAQFALSFCDRFPGRSGWVPARSYGASPSTIRDFIVQRERWVWGLLELSSGRNRSGTQTIPLRRRLLMLHNVMVWALSPLAHPLAVLLVCALLRDSSTAPVLPLLIPLWAFNMAYCIWLYWEGLKVNARASASSKRVWWEPICLILLLPIFALWEVLGIARGLIRFLRRSEARFTVIPKPS
jgi:hypothetical protein